MADILPSIRRLVLAAALLALPTPAWAQTFVAPGGSGVIDADEECVIMRLERQGAASIQIVGSGTATLEFEVTSAGAATCTTTDWVAKQVFVPATGSGVTSATAAGAWETSAGAWHLLRVRASALSSGSFTVTMNRGEGGGTGGGGGGGGLTGEVAIETPNGDTAMDDVNDAVRFNCVVGCAASLTETDDGSIAQGQASVPVSIGLGYLHNGSAWVRIPGTATDGLTVNLGTNNDVTVTGSVTANAGTNLNTSALALETGGNLAAAATSLAALDNAVAGSELQVDIVTSALPTGASTLAEQQTQSTSLATIASDTTDIETAIEALVVAQGSTTSGQSGSLIQGAVTTSAPSYTTGQTRPLSLDTSGALRVTGGTAGTEYVVNNTVPGDPTGSTLLMERDDALSSLAETEGEWTNARANANGALWVTVDGTVTVGSHAVTNAGTFAVQENGAALTALQLLDNAVSGSGFQLSSASVVATVFDLASSNPLAVQFVDTSGVAVAPSQDWTYDSAALTFAPGLMLRFDETSVDTVDEGDAVSLRGSNTGEAYFIIRDGAGNNRGASVTAANELLVELGAGSASIGTLGANSGVDIGDVTINNASGASAVNVQDGGNSLTVDNGGTFAVQESGSALTALQLIDNLVLAQGSTTSGQSGLLAMGAVTTGSPSYTNGQTSPFSLDTSGALRVTGGGGGTEYVVNDPAPTNPTGATWSMERDDALSALSEVEGDWTNPRSNANGALWTAIDGTVAATQSGGWTVAVSTFPDNEPFNLAQWAGNTATAGAGPVASGTPRMTLGSDDPAVSHLATLAAQLFDYDTGAGSDVIAAFGLALAASGGAVNVSTTNPLPVGGNVAHDDVDSGNPLPVGLRAIAHGTNPTAVAAADRTVWYANRAGVPFVMGGHPNTVTLEAQVEDGDGAQTNAALVTVSGGTKVVVTRVTAKCDGSTTGPTNVVVGFGASTLPARAHTGTAGILAAFDGVPAGGGMVEGTGAGILGIGADGEDVRLTMEDPVGGSCSVGLSYYTIES